MAMGVLACERSEPRENERANGEAARGHFLSTVPRPRVSSRVPLARPLFTISPK